MFLEFMTPDVFDALVAGSAVVGLVIAWRRFRADLRQPPPQDAPEWARARHDASSEISSGSDSSVHAPL